MKAGTALGLLAGLGAMNAMSGKPYGGKRFTGLMDMFDGGGAGASGDKFEGGGLLSMLGNLFMKPMQAQQNVERIGDKVRAEKLGMTTGKLGMTTGTPITEYNDSLLAPLVVPRVLDEAPIGESNPLVDAIIKARKDALAGSPEEMQYSGRGNVGMPRGVMEYSGRSDAYMPAVNVNVANDAQPVSEQTILPSDGARVDAQNQANRDRMRQNMATVTREQYDQMSRQEKAALGLPVGGLDLAFAGADAFMPSMQYSGRGTSSGDPEFDEFMRLAANDSSLVGMIDNPVAMRNVFNMYKDIRSGNR